MTTLSKKDRILAAAGNRPLSPSERVALATQVGTDYAYVSRVLAEAGLSQWQPEAWNQSPAGPRVTALGVSTGLEFDTSYTRDDSDIPEHRTFDELSEGEQEALWVAADGTTLYESVMRDNLAGWVHDGLDVPRGLEVCEWDRSGDHQLEGTPEDLPFDIPDGVSNIWVCVTEGANNSTWDFAERDTTMEGFIEARPEWSDAPNVDEDEENDDIYDSQVEARDEWETERDEAYNVWAREQGDRDDDDLEEFRENLEDWQTAQWDRIEEAIITADRHYRSFDQFCEYFAVEHYDGDFDRNGEPHRYEEAAEEDAPGE